MSENEKIAELLFSDSVKDTEYYEQMYPQRNLPEGARVTRFAPSPTGYLHFGGLFTCLVNRRVADSTDGVFYLRIEDTDSKRKIDNGMEDIINGLISFGINIDEGYISASGVKGIYGPYKQSDRVSIYHSFAKKLVESGYAYPCFCTEDDLAERRAQQESLKQRTGYYGEYAVCRDLTYEEIKTKIDSGLDYVIRLRSPGNEQNRIAFDDGIKGRIEMPENDEDFVLLKSDGIPTYHFAHVVDDHLMRTTHVIRGDEWISSVPKHIQLFKLLGFKPPKYAHLSPIMKDENGSKRKLSKRKDPEAAVKYYIEQGYPKESVTEYMLTIANSDFEDWRRANKDVDNSEFKLNLKKMSVSGALFDIAKLNDVSKNIISKFTAERVYNYVIDWAVEYNKTLYSLLTENKEYALNILNIDRDVPKPRKDIAKWSDVENYLSYYYDELYQNDLPLPDGIDATSAVKILSAYKSVYSTDDDKTVWFDKIKSICPDADFCPEMKEYKANPTVYKGSCADAAAIIRSAVTGRLNSPDLCEIMKLLGYNTVMQRIDSAINKLNEV